MPRRAATPQPQQDDVLFTRAQVVLETTQRRDFERSMTSAETALNNGDVRLLASIYSAALEAETKLLAEIDAALEEEAVLAFDRPLNVDDAVAAKVASHDLWILAKIVGFQGHDCVKVEDADDDQRVHVVKISNTLQLPREPQEILNAKANFTPPKTVFAMYPETTAFYRAQVVAAQDDVITVRFQNDENDLGLIPERNIPIRFVTHLPPSDTGVMNHPSFQNHQNHHSPWNHRSLLSSDG